ncbi:hypothetical protein D3C76_1645490 [compost metagenome]
MSDLQSLTLAGEQHRMITDHIPTTNRGEAYGFTLTNTGMTFTPIDRDLLQVTIQRLGDYLAHAQGRT